MNEINKYLFKWQQEIVHDIVYGSNKYGILEKSRRVGGTFTMAIGMVLYCLKTGQNGWFSSLEEKTAKEFINVYVIKFCQLINSLTGKPVADLKKSTTETVYLTNGAKISILTSSPANFRGRDGIMCVDEYAHHENQEELYTAVQPSVAQKGKLWFLSTHNGPGCNFARLCKEAQKGKKDWSHYKVTIYDAVNQGYVEKFLRGTSREEYIKSLKDNSLSLEKFEQEYNCSVLSLSALVKAEQYDILALKPVPDTLDFTKEYGPLFYGIDVGRTNDKTVLWVVEQVINPKPVPNREWDTYDYITVCVKTIGNTDIPTQAAMLRPQLQHPSMEGGYIDIGTVGRALADAFIDEFPHCSPYSFTSQNKAVIAETLKGFIEWEKISLPIDDDIKEQFLSIRREETSSGNMKYEGSTGTSHCDAWWSAGIALQAAINSNGLKVIGMR